MADLRLLSLKGGGTAYTANVMHQSEANKQAHEDMSFQHGWAAALDQLVELMQ